MQTLYYKDNGRINNFDECVIQELQNDSTVLKFNMEELDPINFVMLMQCIEAFSGHRPKLVTFSKLAISKLAWRDEIHTSDKITVINGYDVIHSGSYSDSDIMIEL